MEVSVMDVGPRYLQTMGLTVLDGRVFEWDRADADRGVSIVVNQMMVDVFGWENPVGKQVHMNDTIMFEVIGVVKDFFINGMWSKIEPTLLRLPPEDDYYSMAVRADSDNLPEILESLRETWIKMFPNYPFRGMYQEDTLEEEKSINRSIKQLYIFLAIVATLALHDRPVYSGIAQHPEPDQGDRDTQGNGSTNPYYFHDSQQGVPDQPGHFSRAG